MGLEDFIPMILDAINAASDKTGEKKRAVVQQRMVQMPKMPMPQAPLEVLNTRLQQLAAALPDRPQVEAAVRARMAAAQSRPPDRPAVAVGAGNRDRMDRLVRILRQPGSLRDLMIFKEILDRPLALRGGSPWPRLPW